MTSSSVVPFGRQFREKYFAFDPKLTPLNHGGYGGSPVEVLEAAAKEHSEFRANPDLYLGFQMEARLEPARAEVAKVLDADPLNIGFVHNGTTAANTILRSLPFRKGDIVIAASTTYGFCAATLEFLESLMGIVAVFVQINYPMTSDEIVGAYAKAIEEASAQGTVKLCFFDTVSSKPSARLPWERLVALCKEHGIPSFVDGAHCVGLLENVSLNTVRPDFFITNLHKWFYAPTPASLIYVDQKHHRTIQSFPISKGYTPQSAVLSPSAEKTLFHTKFGFTGTGDYSNYIAVAKAAQFRREVCGGEHAIISYTYDLAKKAAALFAQELNGQVLVGGGPADPLQIETSMVSVYVPLDEYGIPPSDYATAIPKIESNMIFNHHVYIPFIVYNGRPVIRLCAQVYLELADFEYGLQALKTAIKEYQQEQDRAS